MNLFHYSFFRRKKLLLLIEIAYLDICTKSYKRIVRSRESHKLKSSKQAVQPLRRPTRTARRNPSCAISLRLSISERRKLPANLRPKSNCTTTAMPHSSSGTLKTKKEPPSDYHLGRRLSQARRRASPLPSLLLQTGKEYTTEV